LKNDRNCPPFLATFFQSIDYELILQKNGLGYNLVYHFANSSGHPGWKEQEDEAHKI
jgi:hypothetical protein